MMKKIISLFLLILLSISFITPNLVLSASCGDPCGGSSDCTDNPECPDCIYYDSIGMSVCDAAQPANEENEVDLKLNLDSLLDSLPRGGKIGVWSSLTIEGIVSALIPFIYVLAGLALLLMLIVGGFQLMMSAGDPKGVESGRNKLMYALIGFLIIFVSYWLVQILQVVFGLPKIF